MVRRSAPINVRIKIEINVSSGPEGAVAVEGSRDRDPEHVVLILPFDRR